MWAKWKMTPTSCAWLFKKMIVEYTLISFEKMYLKNEREGGVLDMKMTFQPKKKSHARVHGFRKRMRTSNGRKVLARRRAKGRKRLSAWKWLMFEKLRKNSEFQRVYRSGRSKANKDLVMIVEKGESGPSRYGFSVSKKVGNSVVRHHVTRYLRESVRKYDAWVTPGCRIVIIARPAVTNIGLDELCEKVVELYRAHHIWKEKWDEERFFRDSSFLQKIYISAEKH